MWTPAAVRTLLLPLCFLTAATSAYSSGPPDTACGLMIPGHGGSNSQPFNPYSLTVSKSTYSPSETITVTINAPGDKPFKGFMLQARDVNGTDFVGTFQALPGTKF
ncbi:unnamed protein product, partial [Lymnaea stagnalis]